MSILDKQYVVEMPNGDRFAVPVRVIAESRAKWYAKEFDGDATKSLNEDTAPLFSDDPYEIEDWAKNNMNWLDVSASAKLITSTPVDYQDGWINGDCEII